MSEPPQRVSLGELAWTFNHIALASFGGGLSAWSREVLVGEDWMAEEEFLSAMTMCRILPGANQVNMAVFTGTKMWAGEGAIAAVFGLCCVPVLLMLVAAFFYFRFKGRCRGQGRAARRLDGGGRADRGDGHQDRPEVPDRAVPVAACAPPRSCSTGCCAGCCCSRWRCSRRCAWWAWPRRRNSAV